MASKTMCFIALLGFLVALIAAGMGAVAGPAYRWEMVALGDAFQLLRWSAYGGVLAAVVSLAGVFRARPGSGRKGLTPALTGIVLGAVTFWLPYSMQQRAQRVPPIHDITTDARNPPQFEAVVPLRPDGANSLAYGGESLAAQQRKAYPDIDTVVLEQPLESVYRAALETARAMDWRIVNASRQTGRIEAVATTFWFGFEDDVVVRLEAADGETRVDMRSVSRIGVSDIGKNAERIREYMAALAERS